MVGVIGRFIFIHMSSGRNRPCARVLVAMFEGQTRVVIFSSALVLSVGD